jgi:hypothetical protein
VIITLSEDQTSDAFVKQSFQRSGLFVHRQVGKK